VEHSARRAFLRRQAVEEVAAGSRDGERQAIERARSVRLRRHRLPIPPPTPSSRRTPAEFLRVAHQVVIIGPPSRDSPVKSKAVRPLIVSGLILTFMAPGRPGSLRELQPARLMVLPASAAATSTAVARGAAASTAVR
jgi:hypothetical protein